jgi:hypothetical protein
MSDPVIAELKSRLACQSPGSAAADDLAMRLEVWDMIQWTLRDDPDDMHRACTYWREKLEAARLMDRVDALLGGPSVGCLWWRRVSYKDHSSETLVAALAKALLEP